MTDTAFSSQPESVNQTSGGSTITITYLEKPGLGWLSIKNWLLSIITLGVYRFWAKTNVRKHIWSCIHINGEPLEYTGKGMELFLGFLVIFFIILLPFVVLVNGMQLAGYPEMALVFQLFFTVLFVSLYGMAIYRARRYRLSRTTWRGIRGGLTGSSFKYSMLYFGKMILSSITMGWATPAMNLELQDRITNEMQFGDTYFSFKGRSGPLYSRYAACWFGSIFVYVVLVLVSAGIFFAIGKENFSAFFAGLDDALKEDNSNGISTIIMFVVMIYAGFAIVFGLFGIVWSFYKARELAVFASYTKFDNATFRFNATGWSLVGLWLGNFLLVLFTLGIASPFAMQRMVKYFISRLEVVGWIDVQKITQSKQKLDPRGEGMLDAFDLDGF